MPGNIEITQTPDIEKLAAIHAACFEKKWDCQAIIALLDNAHTTAFIAEDYKGFALVRHVAGEAEILTIAVLPLQQKKGLGRSIISAILSWAKTQGTATLFLEVGQNNTAAYSLYTAMKFQLLSRRKNYYRDSLGYEEDALIMQYGF